MLSTASVKKDVRENYTRLVYAAARLRALQQTDSLYNRLNQAAQLSKKTGAISGLEALNIETERARVQQQLLQATQELELARSRLQLITGINLKTVSLPEHMEVTNRSDMQAGNYPLVTFYEAQQQLRKRELDRERWRLAPGLTFGYLNQAAPNTAWDMRLQYGLRIPLFFGGQLAGIRVARLELEKAGSELSLARLNTELTYAETVTRYTQSLQQITFYENSALPQSRKLRDASELSYRNGEIGIIQHLFTLRNVSQTELDYLDALQQYQLSLTQWLYLKGL